MGRSRDGFCGNLQLASAMPAALHARPVRGVAAGVLFLLLSAGPGCAVERAPLVTDTDASAPDCQTLVACCETLTESAPTVAAACIQAVTAGGTACTTTLGTLLAEGRCAEAEATAEPVVLPSRTNGGSASPSTGTSAASTPAVTRGTSTTSRDEGSSEASDSSASTDEDSGDFSSSSGSTASSASTLASPTCANPAASPPVGFVPPTGIIGGGCTFGQTSTIAECLAGVDAGAGACTSVVGSDAGLLNSCGTCFFTDIPPVGNGPTLWGADVRVEVEPAVGDVSDAFLVDDGWNLGGCVIAAGGSAAAPCGLDIMALTACELAVCLPVCPIANPGSGALDATQLDALGTCINTAGTATGACAQYFTATENDCSALEADSGSSVVDQCVALVDQDDGESGAPAPTPQSFSAIAGLLCGGADAGF